MFDFDYVVPAVGYRRWNLPTAGRGMRLPEPHEGETASPRPYEMVQNRCLWNHARDEDGDLLPTTARCRPITHPGRAPDAPHHEHMCGLYGHITLEVARMYKAIEFAPGSVLGAAVFWGRMYFDDKWFRAQYAIPIALVDAWDAEDLARWEYKSDRALNFSRTRVETKKAWAEGVSQLYGIPILPLAELEEYASQFGTSYEGV